MSLMSTLSVLDGIIKSNDNNGTVSEDIFTALLSEKCHGPA